MEAAPVAGSETQHILEVLVSQAVVRSIITQSLLLLGWRHSQRVRRLHHPRGHFPSRRRIPSRRKRQHVCRRCVRVFPTSPTFFLEKRKCFSKAYGALLTEPVRS